MLGAWFFWDGFVLGLGFGVWGADGFLDGFVWGPRFCWLALGVWG